MGGINTLQQAIIYFSDYDNCQPHLWFNCAGRIGVVACPVRCGAGKVTYLAKESLVRKCYAGHEKQTFSLKTGHDSRRLPRWA